MSEHAENAKTTTTATDWTKVVTKRCCPNADSAAP
jgi:hypothetical protein